jgi:hypothetical protein
VAAVVVVKVVKVTTKRKIKEEFMLRRGEKEAEEGSPLDKEMRSYENLIIFSHIFLVSPRYLAVYSRFL